MRRLVECDHKFLDLSVSRAYAHLPRRTAFVAQPRVPRDDDPIAFFRVEDLDLVIGRLVAIRGADRVAADEWTDGDTSKCISASSENAAAIGAKSPLRTPSLNRRTWSSRRLIGRA
jgi:hypothetical protein